MLHSSAVPPPPRALFGQLAICAATSFLVFGYATLERTSAAAVETGWLGATVVLSLVLAAALGGRWLPVGAVALTTVLIALPPGASRATAVTTLAVGWVLAEGIHALRRERQSWLERFSVLAPLALAAQLTLRGTSLFEESIDAGSWILPVARLVGLPLMTAAALALFPDARRAATAVAGVVLFGPGWNMTTTLLAVPVAWALSRLPKKVARSLGGGVVVLFFLCALAAAYPWLEPAPLFFWLGAQPALVIALTLAGAAVALPGRSGWVRVLLIAVATVAAMACLPPNRIAVPLPANASLTAGHPRIRLAVPDVAATRIVLSTSLSNAVELAPGTEVARLEWLSPAGGGDEDRVIFQASLQAGRHTAEWAARRPDVRAFLAGRADTATRPSTGPAAAFHWLAEGEKGPFFGTVYRAMIEPPEALPGGENAALRWIRSPELPPDVLVRIHRAEVVP